MDKLTPTQRSKLMARIRSKDTAPELITRKLLYSMGYHYRLHVADLPGCPDLVFRSRRKVIFVHGCFWHSHSCKAGHLPRSRVDYWSRKLSANKKRDLKHQRELKKGGWTTLVIWECHTKRIQSLERRLVRFLG